LIFFFSSKNPFTQPPLPARLFDSSPQFSSVSKSIFPISNQPTKLIYHLPSLFVPARLPVPIPESLPKISLQIMQPPAPPPVARRLSTNSMDTFVDELFEQMIDPLIQETTFNIFQ
jgi:hypothetical protein